MRISRQTVCLAAVLALANGQAGAQQSAQISIRVIDTDHRPLPNITVEMREVTGCYRPDKSKLATLTRSADDGTATFNISEDARYALIRGGLKDSGRQFADWRCVLCGNDGFSPMKFDFTRRHVSAKYVEPWK